MKPITRTITTLAAVLQLFALAGCGQGAVEATDDSNAEGVDTGGTQLETAKQKLVNGERVHLRAAHSLKCVDVNGASPYNGASVNQWDCWGGANQTFTAVLRPDGSYEFRALHSGKCLDVVNASTSNGAWLQQWDCGGGPNQAFWVRYQGGAFSIEPTHSGKCLDVANYSLANGGWIGQWSCTYALNQLFYIEHAG